MEALEIIREQGDCLPLEDIEEFCQFVGVELDEFFEIIEPFRNDAVWHHVEDTWEIRDFLIPDFDWKKFSRRQL